MKGKQTAARGSPAFLTSGRPTTEGNKVGANSTEFITGGREVDLPARPFRGRMLIDGAWMEAADGECIDRESPAHGVAVSSYPAAKTADVDRAVSAARKAF